MKNRYLRFLSPLLLCYVLVISLLPGCGDEWSGPYRSYHEYSDMQSVFGDLFMYPTYFPDGFNFLEGEGKFYAGADYIVEGSLFRRPAQTADNFYRCYLEVRNDLWTDDGAWKIMVVWLSFPLNNTRTKSKNEIVSDTENYLKIDLEKYVIYRNESHNMTGLRDLASENIEELSKPYEKVTISFYLFFDSENPYCFSITAERYDPDEDGKHREFMYAYALEEAIKVFDSLEPYNAADTT